MQHSSIRRALGVLLMVFLIPAYAQGDIELPQISTQVTSFFGHAQGSYLGSKGSIYAQFAQAINGDRNPDRRLADGDVFVSSQEVGKPEIRAALLLGPDGKIKAAALIHYACHDNGTGEGVVCNDRAHPVMTVFLRQYTTSDQVTNVLVLDNFRNWARRSETIQSKAGGIPKHGIAVKVRKLGTTDA